METEAKKHVFETAELGTAPFRCVAIEDTSIGADENGMIHIGGGQMTKPGGSCDYCGNGIVTFCWIVSKDKKRFKVGTTCVNKTGDAGLKKVVAKHISAKRKVARVKAVARQEIRIEAAKITLEELKGYFSNIESVHDWKAEKGETRYDDLIWMFKNSGHSGRYRVTRFIEKVAADLLPA